MQVNWLVFMWVAHYDDIQVYLLLALNLFLILNKYLTCIEIFLFYLNPFQVNVLFFLTLENIRRLQLFYIFRGYRKGTLAFKRLKVIQWEIYWWASFKDNIWKQYWKLSFKWVCQLTYGCFRRFLKRFYKRSLLHFWQLIFSSIIQFKITKMTLPFGCWEGGDSLFNAVDLEADEDELEDIAIDEMKYEFHANGKVKHDSK